MKPTALLSAFLLALPVLAQGGTAKVGDKVPGFSFARFLNGDGRQQLGDFYGQPIAIDFWGVH